MNFICMRIFFINDSVFNLAFKQRIEATRKWSILSYFVYCNAFTQSLSPSLLSTHHATNFSLNISFKIWRTNEALRFSKNQHSGVDKQSAALQKVIFLYVFVFHLFAFLIIHLSIFISFYIISLFTLDFFQVRLCVRCVQVATPLTALQF